MKELYYNELLKKLMELLDLVQNPFHKKVTVRIGNKTVCSLSKHEIEDISLLWKYRSKFFWNTMFPQLINNSIDSRVREFNSNLSEIKVSGNRGFGKNIYQIKQLMDYAGFEVVEPSDEMQKMFDKLKKDNEVFVVGKPKKKTKTIQS